jgi:hypothetical protein
VGRAKGAGPPQRGDAAGARSKAIFRKNFACSSPTPNRTQAATHFSVTAERNAPGIIEQGEGGFVATNAARRRRHRPEQAIQAAIFEHIAWRGVKGLFAFHVPLGGWRSVIEAKILKSVGTVAGIPDVIAIHDGKVFCLELKADCGRLTDVQRDAHERLREAGATVATCSGLDEAIAQLTEWRLLRGSAP